MTDQSSEALISDERCALARKSGGSEMFGLGFVGQIGLEGTKRKSHPIGRNLCDSILGKNQSKLKENQVSQFGLDTGCLWRKPSRTEYKHRSGSIHRIILISILSSKVFVILHRSLEPETIDSCLMFLVSESHAKALRCEFNDWPLLRLHKGGKPLCKVSYGPLNRCHPVQHPLLRHRVTFHPSIRPITLLLLPLLFGLLFIGFMCKEN